MILVDTSVLIDFLKGAENEKAKQLEMIIRQNLPFGIACYTYQEVLQGAKNEQEYAQLQAYLSTQKVYYLSQTLESYEKAAQLFFTLRRKGITIRSTIDILIALMAMEHGLFLLHNDRDFDLFAKIVPGLKLYA